jgi:glycosyltransferase involved in cell wall biosynthesis
MHIAFVTSEYPVKGKNHGGVGSFVRTLGIELVRNGHQVSVVGTDYEKDIFFNDEGIDVHALGKSGWKFARFIDNSRRINSLLSKIHQTRPLDILETAELGLAFIKKLPGTRYIIRMHGGHHFFTVAEKRKKEWWKVFQEKQSFRKADGIAAVSRYVADTTRSLLKLHKEVRVIYNPVNLYRFKQSDQSKSKRNQLLFIGTVCEKKGVRQLVQALPLVKKRIPDVTLKIAGRDWKFRETGASYTDFLKTHIDKSVESNVKILGPVPNEEIPSLLEESELCVLPSHMEAMPIAWIEALAMGKPFIGSKEGPGPETVIDGKTGLLANPFDPSDIADKIIYMLLNKEKAKDFGKAAREDVINRFDLNKRIWDNINFYKDMLN